MFEGTPSEGIDFYNLLFDNNEFCAELGKVTLAAGRLEAELIQLYQKKGCENNFNWFTLGNLLKFGEEKGLIERPLITYLKEHCLQRNYLSHSIYALFADLLDETILPKQNLIDTDVLTYTEKAWELKENIVGLTDIIIKNNN